MRKFLILAILIGGYIYIKRWMDRSKGIKNQHQKHDHIADMLKCIKCGTYFPENENIGSEDNPICPAHNNQ